MTLFCICVGVDLFLVVVLFAPFGLRAAVTREKPYPSGINKVFGTLN